MPLSIPKGTNATFDKLSLPFKISISKIEKILLETTKNNEDKNLITLSLQMI